jgi:hypothetical protein
MLSFVQDEPSSKRPKVDGDNVKTKRQEPIGKDKSLKKSAEDCKLISDPPGPRVSTEERKQSYHNEPGQQEM